jgi:hypothetical protein
VGGFDRPQTVTATTSKWKLQWLGRRFDAQDDAYQEYEKVKKTSSKVAPPTRAVTGAKIGVSSKFGRQRVLPNFLPIPGNGLEIDGVCCQKRESPRDQKSRVFWRKTRTYHGKLSDGPTSSNRAKLALDLNLPGCDSERKLSSDAHIHGAHNQDTFSNRGG